MEKGNLPEGGRKQPGTSLGEYGFLSTAPPFLFDLRKDRRESEDIPGFDICCMYENTDICGMCGAC